ncbi:MAG: DNA polymerase III subunit delta [Spirochaetaceae bacterium]|jgi:DNA polymerase-3 subunit delta|nr:DNA polymerase III subunit delta [Spirochaetaceae bacterium]
MEKGVCYLFTGPEIGEKADETARIRSALREKYGASLEETTFYALETQTGEMAGIMLNGSLFAEAWLFIIKNAEAVKKKEDVKMLSSVLENLDGNTTVILLSDENGIDRTLEKAVGGNKKIFWEMFESRKREWLQNFFRREGFAITGEAVDTILEMVENNTDALRSQCRNLFLFCDKARPVTEADVERLLSHTRTESTFTLFSAIAGGNTERSLEILHTLLDAKESAVSIFAGLLWCWHKLRDYEMLLTSGASNDFELKKIGLSSPKIRQDYANAARIYGMAEVNRCIALTAETDVQIRANGTALERLALEWYVYKVAKLKLRVSSRGTTD